ncbi:hypothetical protein MWT96_02375 [Prescottella equi]|uniref:hypothetical protein n=1 Tax=Rhodococcus hoagii TaxID=43767 RepID=UPI000A112891|nr:hypothetical protein [Prescottella equi]MBP0078317.1 hypothetical protein [Prescottella equi]MBP0082998.1 hypothetical protein [Prescottella equi]MBP0089186.1 hypothetical protein [Prescottella equi]MBP0092779.1 hypothetical protein [Prescottella equi]MBP0098545.1 hypothetical protein [Prescottella equi]
MRRLWAAVFTAVLSLSAFATTAGAAPPASVLGSSGSLGSSLGSSESSESYEPVDPTAGTLIATSGFDVKRDGFSFANWGSADATHRRGLTPSMMQTLYGDRICARIVDDGCVLTATGQALQADMNENAGGGHCFGFAALAGLFATGQLDKADYLPAGLSVYEAPPSDLLDGLITRYASTQYSPPTNSARAAFPVAGIVEELEAAWDRGENYLLAIVQEGVGGHAVTPIAVRDLGDGRIGIVVYDNNFPGVENMIVANPGADTWYYTTALVPAESKYRFIGSPDNPMNLFQLPQTPAVHECLICKDEGDDSVLVVVKDNAKNRDGTIIDWDFDITAPGGGEIEGLEQVEIFDNRNTNTFRVPAGVAFEMALDGVPAGPAADVDVSLYGDGWINEIDDIELSPGARTSVKVDQDQRKLDLSSNSVLAPTLRLASEQANWSVAAVGTGLRVLPGSTLSVARETDGDYVYALRGVGLPGSLKLDVRHRDGVRDRDVTTGGPVSIPVDSSASVAAHVWNGETPLTVRVEGNGVDRTYPMVPAS